MTEENTMNYVTSFERVFCAQGEANSLLRQIQRRFGPVDEVTTQRIRAADLPHLETWSLNILDAETLEDVFQD